MILPVYHSGDSITAFVLDRLHPYAGREYRRIHDALVALGLRRHGGLVRPRPVPRGELLKAHA